MGDMKYLYNNANGLWWNFRWCSIVETIINVILNIVLGKYMGVHGIILATIISIVICSYIWGAALLFREYFDMSNMRRYFAYHTKYLLVTAVISTVVYFTTGFFENFFVRLPLVLLESVIIYFLVYFKTSIFKESVKMIK